jgi:hypothetical protein
MKFWKLNMPQASECIWQFANWNITDEIDNQREFPFCSKCRSLIPREDWAHARSYIQVYGIFPSTMEWGGFRSDPRVTYLNGVERLITRTHLSGECGSRPPGPRGDRRGRCSARADFLSQNFYRRTNRPLCRFRGCETQSEREDSVIRHVVIHEAVKVASGYLTSNRIIAEGQAVLDTEICPGII